MKFWILSICALALTSCGAPQDPDVKAAGELAGRLDTRLASKVEFVKGDVAPGDSLGYFKLYSSGSKVVVEGDNACSMAMGLNYYLKEYCLTEVSWYRNDAVNLPDVLPAVPDTITSEALVPYRFFLNYCTSGYTMPFWKWEDWEHFIDWMALNGVNLPLATTGQEAIWYNVWSKLGMTDEEIRSYFTGPAHLPWHRMCNLDGWDGPLPKEWIDEQAELQKLIVDRERSLGMKPVLPGFAGHVPAALFKYFPDADTTRVSEWGGFPGEYRCTYLSPTDSLFAVIQREYLTEQTRLYGTDHIYGVDPFNEVDPPTWNPDSLATIAAGIYQSLADVDPDAIWLQMAWLLYADSAHWTPEVARAYIQGVPQGRMILLDYYCENTEEWKLFDSFYGQPYIWCYLGNFGGNSFLVSPLRDVQRRLDDVLENGGSNLVGIGSTLEGLDVNPWAYEYLLENAWRLPLTPEQRFNNIADRRVGHVDSLARRAWTTMNDSIFIQPSLCGQGCLTNNRPSLHGFFWWTAKPNIDYSNAALLSAWGDLLQVQPHESDAMQFDLVNVGRQVLSNYFMAVRDDFTAAYEKGDTAELHRQGAMMKEMLADIAMLLRGHSTFSMKKWIDDARSHGVDEAQKDYYEQNARTLITIWGPADNLNDYANRQWSELTTSYYLPRWAMFIDQVVAAADAGKQFDKDEFFTASRAFENGYVNPAAVTVDYPEPVDAWTISKMMYDKYAPAIQAHPASQSATQAPSLHHW